MDLFLANICKTEYRFCGEDAFLATALEALQCTEFKPCDSPETCIKNQKLSYAPKPDAHLHVSKSEYITIFKKSRLLGKLHNISVLSSESTEPPNIIASSDADRLPGPDALGRGGRFDAALPPVRIPSIYRFVQAMMLLVEKDKATYGGLWKNWITYIMEYCTEKSTFDIDRLPTEEMQVFQALLDGDRDAEDAALLALQQREGSRQ